MLKLNLSNKPEWLDLGHGVRIRLLPLTTALMVAARNDPAISALPGDATDEQSALVFAKALGRLAITDWEGVGDADANPVEISPDGIDALPWNPKDVISTGRNHNVEEAWISSHCTNIFDNLSRKILRDRQGLISSDICARH